MGLCATNSSFLCEAGRFRAGRPREAAKSRADGQLKKLTALQKLQDFRFLCVLRHLCDLRISGSEGARSCPIRPLLSLRYSVAPKKQNLWLLETKDLAYPNTEAKNRPAQPSFFPHQTGRAQSVALW